MINKLNLRYPEINITGFLCPEIMTPDELFKKYKKEIESIDADIVWVSLGFPKQEIFIDHAFEEGRPNINYVGIGGVFEWVAGTKSVAPLIMQNLGLEWLHRLFKEPRRLWKRYFFDFSYIIKRNILNSLKIK